MKAIYLSIAAVFVLVVACPFVDAQTDVNLAQGLEPFKPYMGGNIDSVSLTNGNLMLHIPLVSYPQRGGRLNLGFYLRYNGKSYTYSSGSTWTYDGVGVDVQRTDLWEPRQQRKQFIVPTDNGTAHPFVTTYNGISPDGGSHDLGWSSGARGVSAGPVDGSALGRHGVRDTLSSNSLTVDPSCVNPPITTWYPVISQDPNGNQITTSSLGWTDTLGRLIPGQAQCPVGPSSRMAQPGIYAGGNGTATTTAVRMLPGVAISDFSGCPANTVSARLWLLPAFANSSSASSTTSTMKFCYANFTVGSSFGVAGIGEFSGVLTMLQNVILQDGTMWSFAYNGDGDLSNITFPTGGSISYQWATFQFCYDHSRAITSRTVNDDTGSHKWTYSWTPGLAFQSSPPTLTTVVVTDPAGNDSVHVSSPLGGCSYYETQAKYYQGSQSSGTVVKQVDTEYVTFPSPSEEYSGAPGASFPTRVTTTWGNGTVAKEETAYDTPTSYTQLDLLCYNCASEPMTSTQTRINGQVTGHSVFDYGSGAPGPLLRQTATSYATLDDPSSVITYDGHGNKCAETDYSYDDPSRLVTPNPPVTMMHGTPYNGAVRANLSSTTRLLSATPCSSSANWSQISTYTNYFDTGTVASSTDALGNVTNFSYAPNFYGAYATSTQLPDTTSSGTTVHHTISGDYDFNTGLIRTFTDQNGNSSTYLYNNMNRITSGNFADGEQVVFNYPNANTVEKKQLQSSGSWIDQFVYFDGLGRKKQTQLKDPEGDVFSETSYDAFGRVATVTNPHRAVTSPTDGTTSTAYDVWGRAISVTRPDGSIVQTSYADPTTATVTDEAGKQRRSISDALGRLIEVDEPAGGTAGTAASGGLTISGTLQTKPATSGTAGTGSVTVSGSDQSKAGTSAASGSVSITISGGEQSVYIPGDPYCAEYLVDGGCADWEIGPGTWVYDSGTVAIAVNGHADSANYGYSSTTATIVSGLASAINGDSAASVTASASGSVLTLTSKVTGTAGNYGFSTSVAYDSGDFSGPSFGVSPAGGSLTGGVNGGPPIYDHGTCTVTVNGTGYAQAYSQGDNTSTIASGLASKISAGSLANASASGTTISLAAKTIGAATNYSLTSSTSCSYDSSNFSSPSFTSSTSGANLTGGTDGSPAATDAGTVQMSVGGYTATANYGTGQNTTAAAVASDLVGKVQAQLPAANPLFTISAAGANISINWGSVGTAGNVTVTTASTTTLGAYFPKPSFASCTITANPQNCSTALSGGADPTQPSLSNPWVTLYQYDALGNLLRVDQKGSAPSDSSRWRTRLFTYNSLSQLLTTSNPESGTITYSYDADGNVLMKTSPAPNQTGTATQTISFCYDQLNRVFAKWYSGQLCQTQMPQTPPVVSYVYDQGANGIGHVTSLTDQAGSASYTFDVRGRMATEMRVIAGVSKTMSYEYDLDGSLKVLHYPSGRAVTYTVDSAGRPVSAVDGNGTAYVANTTYYASGAEYQRWMPHIYFRTDLNDRLQITGLYADNGQVNSFYFDKSYNYNSGQNNGSVISVTNNKDSSRSQSFTYDALNRLASAQNAGTDCSQLTLNGKTKFWGNGYTYDAWGNLIAKGNLPGATSPKCSPESMDRTADALNRLHVKTGADYQYDAAGNMTYDTDGVYYSYDPENRITGAAGYTYTYDDDGNRVEKSNGSTGTLYWYMSPGIVAESDLTGSLKSEYVFFGGARVARVDFPGNAASYYLSDHLKTTDIVVDSAGNIKSDSDFYPWGGELQFLANDSNHYKFTSKERDAETGLDYFGARYFSNGLGRWISADWSSTPVPVPYAGFGDPQTLNQYGYLRDNPTTKNDVDGHCDLLCQVIAPIANWLARHPNVSEAAHDVGVKELTTRVGIGASNSKGPVQGEASATAYLSGSKDGLSAGLQGKLSGSVAGVGAEPTLKIPIVKDGALVNPVKEANLSVDPKLDASNEKTGLGLSASPDGTLEASYNKGLVVEVEAQTNGLSELGDEIQKAIVQDIKDMVNSLKQTLTPDKQPEIK